MYETRRILCSALTRQWIDHYLGKQSWADAWLSIGLVNYVTGLYLQKSLGNNEYRYRLRSDILKVCKLDVGQPPLYPVNPTKYDPPLDTKSLYLYEFHPETDSESPRYHLLSLKSPIVLYMMEKWLGKGLIQKTLNKFMVSALSEELPNGISTPHFLRVARKICAKVEMKTFADQWIYGAGCPRFVIKYVFNRKKMMAEFKFIQQCTNASNTVFYVCFYTFNDLILLHVGSINHSIN